MARKMMSMAILFVALAATLLQSSYAATYTVGDTAGWAVPSTKEFYDDWADKKTFAVGDVLEFTFTTGTHDVAEVTEAAYEACTTASPIASHTNGPAKVTLNSAGDKYFICTLPGHCSVGQKLKVEVEAAGAAVTPGSSPTSPTTGGSTPTTPTTGGSTPTTPAPSSASSLAATLSLVILSFATLLFFC